MFAPACECSATFIVNSRLLLCTRIVFLAFAALPFWASSATTDWSWASSALAIALGRLARLSARLWRLGHVFGSMAPTRGGDATTCKYIHVCASVFLWFAPICASVGCLPYFIYLWLPFSRGLLLLKHEQAVARRSQGGSPRARCRCGAG